ncbi:MipA/OmpV family protein [Marinobacter sp. JSM 1782161]|uniref:MipA/OmpV family protein n=1 Tax=Marinobacter sp. JSM 1782161 TaxID=2685906 RepID=UPI001402C3C6|nr:MipA/OmpV family protein [Marinobacter sp. JSM 1782161]
MKLPNALWLTVPLLAFSYTNNVLAEESRSVLVPLPSLDDFTDGDGWGIGLGVGVEYESEYEGSDDFDFEFDPAGALQWRSGNHIYYFAGEAIGWRGLVSDPWLLEASLGFDEGRQESDSDDGDLDGLGDQDDGAEVVLQVRRDLSGEWRDWIDGRLIFGPNGNRALIGYGHRFGTQTDGTGSEIGIVAVFQDSDQANSDFGVDATQSAASGLPPTDLDSGFRSIGANYNYRYNFTEHWQLFGEVLYEHYGDDIADSPVSRHNYEAEVGIGVIYVF